MDCGRYLGTWLKQASAPLKFRRIAMAVIPALLSGSAATSLALAEDYGQQPPALQQTQQSYGALPGQQRPQDQGTGDEARTFLQGQLQQTNIVVPTQSYIQPYTQPAPMYDRTAPAPAFGQIPLPYNQQNPSVAPLQQVLSGPLSGLIQGTGSAPFQLRAPYNTMQQWPPAQSGMPQIPQQIPVKPPAGDGHPNWIPLYAYTNDNMVAPYHALDICWWNKNPIPNKPSVAGLSTSVSRYWRGYVPQPCYISITPVPEAPGNFTFRCTEPNGPRGWLQYLDKPDRFGFPRYRYWLDQRGY